MLKEFFTVSEINSQIKEVINFGFPNAVWVCGEIQGYDRNRDKRHIFFELCEKDPLSKDIVARIGLVIFDGKRNFIQQLLKEAQNAFALKDDIEVKFLCRIDFYPPHGAMRLVVESIDPVYTLGKIAQDRQRLIALLKQKGVLDKNKLLEIPTVPLRIGLITAYDSAAYNDFMDELKQSGYGFEVFCFNAVMQGKNTEASICRGLDVLKAVDGIDLIVITRGGGSIADLSCFDSEKIAMKIASMPLPIVTGIGHEINTTVTDLAAHTFAKTPTAIAQFLIGRIEQFVSALEDYGNTLIDLSIRQIEAHQKKLKFFAMHLQSGTTRYIKHHDQYLVQLQTALKRHPAYSLAERRKHIEQRRETLIRCTNAYLLHAGKNLLGYQKVIEAVNPVNTLKRGFSITRTAQGKTIRNINQVQAGESIMTELIGGIVRSKTESVELHKETP